PLTEEDAGVLDPIVSHGVKNSPVCPSLSPNGCPLLAPSFRGRRARPRLSPLSYDDPFHSFPALLVPWQLPGCVARSPSPWRPLPSGGRFPAVAALSRMQVRLCGLPCCRTSAVVLLRFRKGLFWSVLGPIPSQIRRQVGMLPERPS